MDEVEVPTCQQLYEDDEFRLVHDVRGSWRHGYFVTAVYLRESDNTYWKARYRLSTDGETNELASRTAEISRCWPFEKMVVDYADTPRE